MAIPIQNVPMWLVLGGKIGHALAQTQSSGWHYTICGTLTPNGDLTTNRPARICAKCRKVLKRITITTGKRESASEEI